MTQAFVQPRFVVQPVPPPSSPSIQNYVETRSPLSACRTTTILDSSRHFQRCPSLLVSSMRTATDPGTSMPPQAPTPVLVPPTLLRGLRPLQSKETARACIVQDQVATGSMTIGSKMPLVQRLHPMSLQSAGTSSCTSHAHERMRLTSGIPSSSSGVVRLPLQQVTLPEHRPLHASETDQGIFRPTQSFVRPTRESSIANRGRVGLQRANTVTVAQLDRVPSGTDQCVGGDAAPMRSRPVLIRRTRTVDPGELERQTSVKFPEAVVPAEAPPRIRNAWDTGSSYQPMIKDARSISFQTCSDDASFLGRIYSTTSSASTAAPGRPTLSRSSTTIQPSQTSPKAKLIRKSTVDFGVLSHTTTSQSRTASAAPISMGRTSSKISHDADERGASVPPPPATVIPAQSNVISSPTPRVFPTLPSPPERQSAHVDIGRQLLAASLGATHAPPQQLRLIVAGLMGSGKSTICRMLNHLFEGVWVNQDEFSHCGKGAKRAFLAEISRAAGDKKVPVVLVDKISTMRQHRREILESMQSGIAGNTVLLQMRHPQDAPDRWENAVRLCESRIRSRGDKHRTLMGNNPDLQKILRMTVSGVEPMTDDELQQFRARFEIDMTLDPVTAVIRVLSVLDDNELLYGFDADELMSEPRLMEALRVAQSAEVDLAGIEEVKAKAKAKAPKPKKPWNQRPGGRSQSPEPIWYWAVDIDSQAVHPLLEEWRTISASVPDLNLVADLHTTLLYLGGGSDKEIAARHPHLGGPQEVQTMRANLAAREGQNVDFEVVGIAWDNRIAAAEVMGLGDLCANLYPHVTLATGRRVPPQVSNELLARRNASVDLQCHLGPWLSELGLGEYENSLREWCTEMGAVTPEEIAENSEDAAAAIENKSIADRDRVQGVLARAACHELHYQKFEPPLRLTGCIRPKRRGT